MPTSKMVNTKGEKIVLVKTTRHNRNQFTVVLTDTKLKAFLTFE